MLTLGLIAKNLGSAAASHIKGLLDTIIGRGLSQPLSVTCALVAEYIPEMKRDVQEGLLKRISVILANTTGIGVSASLTPSAASVGVTQMSPSPISASGHRHSMPSSRLVPLKGRFPAVGSASGQMRTSAVPLPGFPWGEAFSKTSFVSSDIDLSGDALIESQLVSVALKTLGTFDFEGEFTSLMIKLQLYNTAFVDEILIS